MITFIIDLSNAVHGREYSFGGLWDVSGAIAPVKAERGNVEGTYTVKDGGVAVKGRLSYGVLTECSLCAVPVRKRFDAEFDEVFTPGGEGYLTDMRTLDLEPLIRDEALFALPARFVCREDCKGLCQHCGLDLNTAACGCASKAKNPAFKVLDNLFD